MRFGHRAEAILAEVPPPVRELDLGLGHGAQLGLDDGQGVAQGSRELVDRLRRPRGKAEAGGPATDRAPGAIGVHRPGAATPGHEGEGGGPDDQETQDRDEGPAYATLPAAAAGCRRVQRAADGSVVLRLAGGERRQRARRSRAGRLGRPRRGRHQLGAVAARGIEVLPAIAREVDLDPGVRRVRPNDFGPVAAALAGQVALGDPGRDTVLAQEDGHHARVELAVAGPDRGEALHHGQALAALLHQVLHVGVVLEVARVVEEGLHRLGDVVGVVGRRPRQDLVENRLGPRADGVPGDVQEEALHFRAVLPAGHPQAVRGDLAGPGPVDRHERSDRVGPLAAVLDRREPVVGASGEDRRVLVDRADRVRADDVLGDEVRLDRDLEADLSPARQGHGVVRRLGQEVLAGRPIDLGRGLPAPGEVLEVRVDADPPVEALRFRRRQLHPEGHLVGGVPGPDDPGIRPEGDDAGVARGTPEGDDPLEPLGDLDDRPRDVPPEALEGRRGSRRGQEQRPEDGSRDEDRAAAQVEAAHDRRVTDPSPDPGHPLVEGMGSSQEDEPGEREEDHQAQLVVRRQGHVAQQGKARDDDRIEGPPVAEHRVGGELAGRPDERPEGNEVVPELVGEGPALDREVLPDADDDLGRGAVAGRQDAGSKARDLVIEDDPAGNDRDHDRGEGDAQQMGRPATPAELGPGEADGHAG